VFQTFESTSQQPLKKICRKKEPSESLIFLITYSEGGKISSKHKFPKQDNLIFSFIKKENVIL